MRIYLSVLSDVISITAWLSALYFVPDAMTLYFSWFWMLSHFYGSMPRVAITD